MTRPALLVAALALAACADPAPPPADDVGGEVAAPPGVSAVPADAEALAGRPGAPLAVVGACPFEGCTYGTWTTSAETTVYGVAADTTSAAFTVPAGAALEAEGGFALVTRIGEAVATQPTELYLVGGGTAPLVGGETVYVLDYEGEGSYRVWHDGRLAFSGAGSGIGVTAGAPDASYRQTTPPEAQWWARVTAPDGRAGWLWMDRTPSVTGADAFAAP